MKLDIRMTKATMLILDSLLSSKGQSGLSGAEISRQTNLLSGTIYPVLHRLERAGWLDSYQESGNPKILQRPRRRFYSLNSDARAVVVQKLQNKGFNKPVRGILGGTNGIST